MGNAGINRAFIYMPFACRGKTEGSLENVTIPQETPNWRLVESDDSESLEELYLYSYIFGLRTGDEGKSGKRRHRVLTGADKTSGVCSCDSHTRDESRSGKYRHYVFKGAEESGNPCDFLTALREVAEKESGDDLGLFNLDRELLPDGPILDNGSQDLKERTLGELFFPDGRADETAIAKLRACDCWRILKAHRYPKTPPEDWSQPNESKQSRWYYLFDIHHVHCYWFTTGIAVLVFELSFRIPDEPETSVADWVASGMFHLKKVQNVRILPAVSSDYSNKEVADSGNLEHGISLCNLGKLLACDLLRGNSATKPAQEKNCRPYLFFHAPAATYKGDNTSASGQLRRKSMRANSLVYVAEVTQDAPEAETKRKLFYLSNCFDVNVPYADDSYLQPETLVDSPDIRWGITPENLACLASYSDAQEEPYVIGEFLKHVCYQHKFIYLLLLHQKFNYYRLLNEVGAVRYDTDAFRDYSENDATLLSNHREKLEWFNATFTFSRITEVAQYQKIYEIGAEVMGLNQLKIDVYEPLQQLVTRQEKHVAKQQELYSKRVNILAIIVAIAGFGSVFTDVASYMIPNYGIATKVVVGILIVVAIAIVAILLKPRERDGHKP